MSTMKKTAGHGDGSTGSSLSVSRWSELPDDILGMVRLRIDSPRDRACLAAVCRPWRGAMSWLPATPAVPWLILSPGGRNRKKHLCGPNGSWVMRVSRKAAKKRIVGSYQGGWIAATDDRELLILNLFSSAEVVLSAKQRMLASMPSLTSMRGENGLKKIIFSGDPASSSGCTLAALRNNRDSISVCRVGCPGGGWSTHLWLGQLIWDIAFYNGELYGLTRLPEILIRFEITVMDDGTPVITATHTLSIQERYYGCYNPMDYDAYIVELHGKLLIAVWDRWLCTRESFFRVFELVDANNQRCKYKWSHVTSFGDYALFLGWSKAIHVPVGGRHGLKRNHIYYCLPTTEEELPDDKVYSVTSGDGDQIYCREDQSMNDGVGRTGYYLMRCYNSPMWQERCNSVTWLYPPDL
ncbi:unnamed protein product [Alopecurus aequalis]